jgi:hypothetical protein
VPDFAPVLGYRADLSGQLLTPLDDLAEILFEPQCSDFGLELPCSRRDGTVMSGRL